MQTRSSSKINKRKFILAILKGDVKTAKQLIGESINVNFILDDFTPLWAALEVRSMVSMDMVEFMLSNVVFSIWNELTVPLVWSLQSQHFPEKFILRLIRAGCDINASNENEETPLYLSVKYDRWKHITHELLKRDVYVNAQDKRYNTPLHLAVAKKDLELVCMLLNYNADVFIKNKDGHTPFSYALHLKFYEIAEVLSNYYSFLDDDVNYIINNDAVFEVFLKYTNAELFKAVWPRFDPDIILSKCQKLPSNCFINFYIDLCKYSTSDWLECLYLILNSGIAFDLIHCNRFTFYALLRCMRKRHVQSDDRIGLIYMMLSLGVKLTVYELNDAVAFYGLSQELELFICANYNSSITDGSRFVCPLHAFVIGMETDFSVKKITQLFHVSLDDFFAPYRPEYKLAETLARTVSFFSFPADAKNSLMSLKLRCNVVMDKKRLQEIPEFPSLTELSRNQIHKYLVQTFRFKQPYQLQDCVKKLLIPNKIKDIILFKEPIY